MPKPKILFLSDISVCPDAIDPLREIAEVRVLPATPENLAREIVDSDACFAALAVRLTDDLMATAKKPSARPMVSNGLAPRRPSQYTTMRQNIGRTAGAIQLGWTREWNE